MLKNKKGFTLIEIVIVIVIIAILAAILVPNLVRWIDKAKLATLKSEADTVRTTVTSQIAQEYKDMDTLTFTQDYFASNDEFWTNVSQNANTELQCSDDSKDGYIAFSYENGALVEFVYATDGHTATFDGTNWTYE